MWAWIATLLSLNGSAWAIGGVEEHDGPATNAIPDTPQDYYAVGIMMAPNREPQEAEYEVVPFKAFLKAKGIKDFVYIDPTGTSWRVLGKSALPRLKLDQVPPLVMVGVIDVLKREQRGVETDLLLRGGNGERQPFTMFWRLDNSVRVELGSVVSLEMSEGPPAEELSEKWGLELAATEGAEWSRTDTGLLDAALGRLSDAERACIADLPMVRTAEAAMRSGNSFALAVYFAGVADARLEFFQLDRDRARTVFRGFPDDPVPVDVATVVHELGHAISRAEWRRRMRDLAPLMAPVMTTDPKTGRTGFRFPVADDLEAVRADWASKGEQADAFERGWLALWDAGWGPERVKAFYAERADESAVEKAFGAKMGDRWAPSRYATTDLTEGFAEFFGYWKTDPAAMERVYPDVVDWFESGEHLAGCPARQADAAGTSE